MMRIVVVLAALVPLSAPLAVHAAELVGDAERGQEVYERCEGCHSLNANRVGPMHRSVYGRKAGSVADYAYSAALKKATIVWNAETLDRWLQGPGKLVPGTKMGFMLKDPQARADVIAFLKRESGQ